MADWIVTIKLYFMRTNIDRTIKEEPNPTMKELDAYMRKETRYETYIEDLYLYGEYGEMPEKIKYTQGGEISYQIKNNIFATKKSVIEDIMSNSLEDGMFGASAPSHGVYPTKKKYSYSYNNGKIYSQHEELGVIDCRKKSTIVVEKVAKTKNTTVKHKLKNSSSASLPSF